MFKCCNTEVHYLSDTQNKLCNLFNIVFVFKTNLYAFLSKLRRDNNEYQKRLSHS